MSQTNVKKTIASVKDERNLELICKLNLLKNQINYYKEKLISDIYYKYIASCEKLKKKPTLVEFKNNIMKQKRKDTQNTTNVKYSYDESKCDFIVWNKGHLRQCQFVKLDSISFCKKHQNSDNLLEDYYFNNLQDDSCSEDDIETT